MSIDSFQKRASALNPRCVFYYRVDPTETGFNEGNRRAALYSYSLIDVGTTATVISTTNSFQARKTKPPSLGNRPRRSWI